MFKNKKVLKADESTKIDGYDLEEGERFPTEFEYLKAKVDTMADIISRLQAIIKQNNLKYVTEQEDYAEGDIDDLIWVNLNEDE